MSPRKIVIAAPPFARSDPGLLERLRKNGFDPLDVRPAMSLEEEAFRGPLSEAWAIIPGNAPHLGSEFLDLAPELRLIAKMGVGLDNIDIPEATRRGVLVCNSPGVNTAAVADYTLGLILALARQIVRADSEVRAGRWTKLGGFELEGRTLGLVGLGAIGRAVAARARGFGMELIAHDTFWPTEEAERLGVRRAALDELFRQADIVSLHCPLTPDTERIVNSRTLALMKPSALIINTARGGLIDDAALIEALSSKKIGGAGLDAFEQEPLRETAFLELDNVILSPHTAWFSEEAMARMNESVVEQVIRLSRGEKPDGLVNEAVFENWLP